MIRIGDWQVDLINDCWMMMDGGGAFGLVPKVLWQKHLPADENNLVPFSATCMLLRGYGHIAVVDTGMGYKVPSKLQKQFKMERPSGGLMETLNLMGVLAEKVDTVICTHLHSDHAGGNTKYDEQGQLVASFPNATYYVQEQEYSDAMRPNERTRATYQLENYSPLFDKGQLKLINGDTEILPGVKGTVTRGHTPGHMSVKVNGRGKHLGFVCDLASLAIHFENLGWMASYDLEPLYTLENKREWHQWALEHKALLVFPHDVNRPICQAREIDGKLVLINCNERWINE